MFCTEPITIYRKGVKPVMNPATGIPEWPVVACGHCPTCIAGRKNDWAGRLVAEARAAKDVYFVTLTYKEEPEAFRYLDVQLMLKRLRVDLERKYAGTKLRFFCVGERGNKFGRIHWHLLLFADQPLGWSAWNKYNHRNELWEYWEHGWTDIAKVPTHDTVRRVRYCAKYAVKTVGQEDKACRFRCSLKPAIGAAYLTEWVDTLVLAGLPLKGWFTIPGMIFDRGHRNGQLQRFRLKGASARMVARLYADGWARERAHKPWPSTPFMQRYYPEEMMERRRLWPDTIKPFDWARDPEFPREMRAVNPFNQRLEDDKRRFDLEWQEAADETKREALERSYEQSAYGCEWERLDQARRYRAARADQAERAGYSPGDPVGDAFVEDGKFPGSDDERARRLAEIRWDEGDGVARRDVPGARIRDIERIEARARFDAEARAINARGFEAVEGWDPETGEIRAEYGAPIRFGREAARCDPHRAIEWAPRPGGAVEAIAASVVSFGRGYLERRKAKG